MGKDTLTGLKVHHAMRRQLITLQPDDTIDCCIQYLTKYKINALLIGRSGELPAGVVSKTDIMSAWYSGLPLSTQIEMIMNAPPLFCDQDDTLDSALNTMKTNNIYRLYALNSESSLACGVIAYPDIVGLLYHYCSRCSQGLFNKSRQDSEEKIKRYKVLEFMTKNVESCKEEDSLESVIETLAASRFGAVLIADDKHYPKGVISRTDIILCWRHGLDLATSAREIMSEPVALCHQEAPLESAIKSMILKDLHRLFVVPKKNHPVSGIVSLTDAARLRSGSCHACISSRIRVDEN